MSLGSQVHTCGPSIQEEEAGRQGRGTGGQLGPASQESVMGWGGGDRCQSTEVSSAEGHIPDPC